MKESRNIGQFVAEWATRTFPKYHWLSTKKLIVKKINSFILHTICDLQNPPSIQALISGF